MIANKFFIFLLMVTTLDCNNAVLARRLNPTSLKKLICKIVYPMPCTNVQLKITLSEGTRKTTVKPKQERAEKNKNENEINYMLRV